MSKMIRLLVLVSRLLRQVPMAATRDWHWYKMLSFHRRQTSATLTYTTPTKPRSVSRSWWCLSAHLMCILNWYAYRCKYHAGKQDNWLQRSCVVSYELQRVHRCCMKYWEDDTLAPSTKQPSHDVRVCRSFNSFSTCQICVTDNTATWSKYK